MTVTMSITLQVYSKTKTYIPRKHFYAIQQVSKFLSPGSFQVAVSARKDSLTVLAFQDTTLRNLTIVGINTSNSPTVLTGSLANLPFAAHFEMYHTNSTQNLHKDADIAVKAKAFKFTVPANSIFTLKSITEQTFVKRRPSFQPQEPFSGLANVMTIKKTE